MTATVERQTIPVTTVRVGAGHRKADPAKVRELADSIAQVGQLQPIAVTPDGELIFGLHRLEAHKLLGLADIWCERLDKDALRKRLAEIDENVIRSELTRLERGEQMEERSQILDRLGVLAKRGGQAGNQNAAKNEGATVAPSFQPKTTAQIAAEAGISERTLQRDRQVARNIAKSVRETLKNTPIGNSTNQLLALSRQSPDVQQRFADAVVTGDKAAADEIVRTHAPALAPALAPDRGAHKPERRMALPADDPERAAAIVRKHCDAAWIERFVEYLLA